MGDISLDFTSINSPTYQDYLVLNNDLVMTSDLEEGGTDPVLQNILQNLRWYAAEWFLDIQDGVPWFQEIFVKNPDIDKINALLLGEIQEVPGVVLITQFSTSPSFANRSFGVQFSVQKSTGTISYSGILNF